MTFITLYFILGFLIAGFIIIGVSENDLDFPSPSDILLLVLMYPIILIIALFISLKGKR